MMFKSSYKKSYANSYGECRRDRRQIERKEKQKRRIYILIDDRARLLFFFWLFSRLDTIRADSQRDHQTARDHQQGQPDREKERHPTPYPETSTAHPPRYPTARKFFSFFQFQPTPTLTLRLIHSTKANLTTKNSVLSVYPTSVRLANNPCF